MEKDTFGCDRLSKIALNAEQPLSYKKAGFVNRVLSEDVGVRPP